MADPAIRRMTLAEFLEWDDGTDRRYELIDGVPVAMAPAKFGHGRLQMRLASILETNLQKPCQGVIDAGIAFSNADDSFFVADLAVFCVPIDLTTSYHLYPQTVFEILSRGTAREDRLVKLPKYREVPSLQEIVLLHADRRKVELWTRRGTDWRLQELEGDAALPLASLALEIGLATIYDGIVD
ncbi:MAG: hypothetical protein GVY13_12725 [Alphaproteobacteria bacterium]|jgi:Uma2 family endonuclease|nr:hypothetical protein [Alphaproteobacteria bacterium]